MISISSRLITLFVLFFSINCYSQTSPEIHWKKTFGSSSYEWAKDVLELSDGSFIFVGLQQEDGYVIKTDSQGNVLWEKVFGGAKRDIFNSVVKTSDGNILIGGTTISNDGDASGPPYSSTENAWLVKIDLQGNKLFHKVIYNVAYPFLTTKLSSIKNTVDGNFIFSGTKYINSFRFEDIWIVKIDNQANVLWEKIYGGTREEEATSIDLALNGGFIVSAHTRSDDGDISDHIRPGVYNFWILKLDNLGNKIWDKKYGGSGYNGSGDIPNSIKSTYDKGSIVVGEGRSSDGDLSGKNRRGYPDYWVLKLDSLGSKQWSKTFGGDYYDKAYSVQICKDSNYVVSGSNYPRGFYDYEDQTIFTNCTSGSALDNFGIIKINKQGDLLWRKCMGGSQSDYAYSMKITSDEGFIMVGETNSSNGDITGKRPYNDVWVVKLDKECNGVVPTATVNPNISICKGDTINLSAGNLIDARYFWKGPNAYSSTSRTPIIPNSQAMNEGIYSVTVTQNGCTAIATTNVKVGIWLNNSTPIEYQINSNSPVCINKALTFDISTSNSNSNYSWTGSNGFSSTLQNPQILNVTLASSGIYTVTVTSGNCIESATKNIVINVPTIVPTFAIANNTPTWENNQFSLSVNVAGADYFTWKNPSNQEISYSRLYTSPYNTRSTNSGIYSVEVWVGGCSKIETTNVLIVSPSAVIASKNSPLCIGTTLKLSVPEINTMTYVWSGPNSFSSTLREPQIPNISSLQNGIYTIKGYLNGYSDGSSTVNVLITPPPTATTNSPICEGANLNLSVTAVNGAIYSWTGSNGFTSTLRNPTIASSTNLVSGNYSVIVSLIGCTATSSTSVIVNPLPTASITTNSPICAGANLNLSVTETIGATYYWTGPNGFTSSLRSPTVNNATNLAGGTYMVRVSLNGCVVFGLVSVLVKPLPTTTTITTNSPICAESNLSLSVIETVGATYSWIGTNGFTSSLRNPTITNVSDLANGNYSAIISLDGCLVTSSMRIVVNPLPTVTLTSNTPICAESDLNLSVTEIIGATYLWTGINGFTSTLRNPIIVNATNLTNGNYSVIISLNSCVSTSTINVIVNPLPTVTVNSNSPICADANLNLSVTETLGATYLWIGSNSFTSSLRNPTITNVTDLAKGNYSVTVSLNGCAVTSSTSVFVSSSTSKLLSAQSGNWKTNSTWLCGSIPEVSSEVLIKSGHIIELDSEVSIKKIDMETSATLRFLNNLAKIIFASQ